LLKNRGIKRIGKAKGFQKPFSNLGGSFFAKSFEVYSRQRKTPEALLRASSLKSLKSGLIFRDY